MKPDILVLTPTLGNRKSLERTVASLKSVGGGRVKHIIVAPHKEVVGLKAHFPELEVLAEPDNEGIYPALNYGFRKYAKDYKYLTFINDDDYWLPDFKSLFNILDTDNSIDVVYGRVNYVDENGKIIGEQTSSSRYKSFKLLLSQNIVLFTQQATLIRTELFIALGGFDTSYQLIADTKFWLKAIESKAVFHFTNTICAAYMIQNGQLSSNGNLQKEEHFRLLADFKISIFKAIIEKWLFRITNIRIYIRRFIKNKEIKRMSSLFHTNS